MSFQRNLEKLREDHSDNPGYLKELQELEKNRNIILKHIEYANLEMSKMVREKLLFIIDQINERLQQEKNLPELERLGMFERRDAYQFLADLLSPEIPEKRKAGLEGETESRVADVEEESGEYELDT